MNKPYKKPGVIKAAVGRWLGLPVDLRNEEFWSQFGGNAVGQAINEKTVLQLSTVWACARLIAETISTMPLNIYETTGPGTRRVASDHQLQLIVHDQPNNDSTACVFWEAFVVSMLLQGNGFAEKKYIGTRLVALHFLVPGRLAVTKSARGMRQYRYTDTDGTQREIAPSRIFRVPGFTINGDWGLSAIQYGAQVFGSAMAAQTAANSIFEKGLQPTVAFTIDRVLKPEQREDFRKMLKTVTGALNAGESPLLEAGMTATNIGVNPNDAQLLETKQFSVEEICRWFRVPPHMVGHVSGSTSWGTGIEQQMLGFLMFTLRPWLNRIKQGISKDLIAPAERLRLYAEFNVEALLQADSKGRAEYLGAMVDKGLMTRDEGRAKENLPPKGGNADVLTVNSAQMPLDKLGVKKQ